MIKVGNSIRVPRYHRAILLFLFIFLSFLNLQSQPPFYRTQNYIENYSEAAVTQMVGFKIPASVILAQAILESRSGTSELAKRSNNHFGIKCHKGWQGDT